MQSKKGFSDRRQSRCKGPVGGGTRHVGGTDRPGCLKRRGPGEEPCRKRVGEKPTLQPCE